MNTDEITHLLKHLLAHSRAGFVPFFPSDKRPPLNTIQSLIPCCYVSNIDPTRKGGSHSAAFFHSRPNRLNFLIVMEDNHVNSAFHFQNPLKYFIIPTKYTPLEPGSVGILYIHSLSSGSQLFIAFNM